MAQSAAPNNPFIKQLVHNDRQVRDKAVASLRTFLSRSTPFSQLDFLKLWKGLFYCMWSCDKPAPQRRLALDLSALVSLLSTRTNFIGYMRAFWTTIAREYTGIDSLRMDKFLFLIRSYVNAGFAYCAKSHWKDEVTTKEYLDLLREIPLNPRDAKVPTGLKYHVVDVYVDELEKVGGEKAPYEELMQPLVEFGQKAVLKSVRKKVDEALDDGRVKVWLGIEDEDDDEELSEADEEVDDDEEDEDEEFGGFDD
ncbi:nucleolar [Aureobasidium namibiae CBS 147.97]|uniref:Nucleolar n=1 Tax=Aureobasidium namibiae CBS 147.97 TaxID=1043004 RepID=A0A074WQY3_9PEZI